MKNLVHTIVISSVLFLYQCGTVETSKIEFNPFSLEYQNQFGRTRTLLNGDIELIGAASYLEFIATGDSLKIPIINSTKNESFVTIFFGSELVDKFSIASLDTTLLSFDINGEQMVKLVKDTEAANGSIVIPGIWAENVKKLNYVKDYLIEFIGNSITCGMGADTTDIYCGEKDWFSQHRGSLAYGPLVSDSLNANYILSSVSGIGIYRNWNDENILEPNMPQVYDNLYLNLDSAYKYEPQQSPDLISICLGTNDLSDGDGIKERLPFNKEKYISGYIKFVQRLIDRSPNAKIALLTSPMVGGEKGELLKECLNTIATEFKETKVIEVFEFEPMVPTGCTYHPSIEEHQIMANQLIPFYRDLFRRN